MDTNELIRALREATHEVEPRPTFTADVLRGAHRRRSRNRFTIGAALVGTAAVAVAAVTALPSDLAAPPPADQPRPPYSLLEHSGGDLIDDETVTRNAVLGWLSGLEGGAGEGGFFGVADLVGEPHVYWAGTTPLGAGAIVTQEARPENSGRLVVSGLVVDNPDDDRPDELELVGVHVTGVATYLLPDNRTVLSATPGGDQAVFISTEITVEDGRSVRDWTELTADDGIVMTTLDDTVDPLNVRLVTGPAGGDPSSVKRRRDDFLPLVTTGPTSPRIEDQGLPWPAEFRHLPEPRLLPQDASVLFWNGLSDSGLLDPISEVGPRDTWMVAADLPDGRTLILSQQQELNHPAWVISVLLRPDGSEENVTRVKQIDPASSEPVIVRAPGDQGWVAAAWGQQISYRTSTNGDWQPLGSDAALVPHDAVEIQTGETVTPLD